MKTIKQFITKYFISDEQPFDARILNFVCFLGSLAATAALTARILEGMAAISIFSASITFIIIAGLFYASSKQLKIATGLTVGVVYMLGLVVWPAIFFINGGSVTGMPAYFTLAIILDFLLLKGAARIGGLILTSAAIIFCYVADLFWGWALVPADSLTAEQILIDNLQSIFVAGFFMGAVIIFQKAVYLKEKDKAEAAVAGNLRKEELLTLVNEAAAILLTVEPDNFNDALHGIMGKLAGCLDLDCVYIWRLDEKDSVPVYTLLYDWFSDDSEKKKHFEEVSGSRTIPRMAQWDEKMFGERGYLSEYPDAFDDIVRDRLTAAGVKAVMGFPVFFQGGFWGFVSFENRHSSTLCSEDEAAILKSGSLLLANAIERNENILQLSERLTRQQVMSEISRSFISKEPLGSLIHAALARMGVFLNVSRVLIAVFEKGTDVSRPRYVWFSEPKYAPDPSKKGFSKVIRELFPQNHESNDNVPGVYCNNVLTYENGKFKIFHELSGMKSVIFAPIYVDGELWGSMSVEEHSRFRRWSEDDSLLTGMVSSAISNAVARDVIEKERSTALEQALNASRAKSDFLSNMSHEIRTPMNAIIGMTSIGRAAQNLEKKDYAFDKIDNASKHLLGVINDILDMSKIEANKLELSSSNFEFENLLQKVVNVVNFRVDERRQRLYVNIDNKIPRMVIGDDQRLAQVITNLLSNAVKFTPEEGSIRLDAKLLSDDGETCRLQIEVTDTGIGITEEQKARLFRSFEQAEAGTSRKYGGTGLGLAISKRIVQLMDGDIWVDSEPGHGSKFAFIVSLKRGADECRILLDKDIDRDNIHIFAVDDEPEILEFFEDVCHSLDISCTVASSAEEATRLLDKNDNYIIYFIDWKLPGMNGVELSKLIRAKVKRKSIVIIFSSIDWSVIEDDAREAGVDKFLPKPLFKSEVIDLINDCIVSKANPELSETEKSTDDFTGYSVLLAEDVDINREIVIELLEPTNLVVECAENGVQALKMFEVAPEKYDMIFMDVQMPEMDGHEATRRIRALNTDSSRNIPIVAMTANVFKEDIERCLADGMNDHVGKPIDFDEVMAMLRKYLR